ncbi:MAG: histidine phosphatase family protein [Limnohabitans sp.]|jgi:broad specificity phosphatase PhoE|uniref:histidine phosphatase family protein n=1 Tax=Limnohabitans sp. TaxID=1907725 RepID=UPI0011D4A486|nr:MAG: histidine phosphatase family protein [Limnohabitans sp.]
MGTLYLVRHGQASFGEDDYDRLSPLGHRQAQRLGEYLRQRFAREGVQIDTVLMGSLTRHRETWEGIAQGAGWSHEPQVWPGLNEYDSHALLEAIHPEPLAKPDTPELYRHHFRLLRDALKAWMDGRIAPKGMPVYSDFVAGIEQALDHVRQHCAGNALIVSSGGPISTAVGRVLGTPAETTIELNLRIRNTALTEFAFNPKRHMLVTYNTLPHLDSAEHKDWVTYA